MKADKVALRANIVLYVCVGMALGGGVNRVALTDSESISASAMRTYITIVLSGKAASLQASRLSAISSESLD